MNSTHNLDAFVPAEAASPAGPAELTAAATLFVPSAAGLIGNAALPLVAAGMMAGLVGYFEVLHRFDNRIALSLLIAIFIASSISSIAGFAFSAICGAILFHLGGRPVQIVEIMMLCSIAIQSYSVLALRNALEWRCLARFLAGGLAGLPLGVYLLVYISPWLYMKCAGSFLVLYGIYMILRRPVTLRWTYLAADVAAGFVGGITGGFAGFPGAFVTIWCGLKGWAKEQQRGVYQPYILIMQVLALFLISLAEMETSRAPRFDPSLLAYVPAAVLGTWCGIAIFRRLTDRQFTRWVNLLLVVSGLGLLS